MCPDCALMATGPPIFPGQSNERRASWPVGRILCTRFRGPTVIHLGLPLPTASCGLPADSGGPPSIARAGATPSRRHALLTLLQVGFTEPPQSPAALVVSYTTVSPLPPAGCSRPARRRSVFCGTFPRVTPGRRYRPPCPAESGPSSAIPANRNRRDRPASSPVAPQSKPALQQARHGTWVRLCRGEPAGRCRAREGCRAPGGESAVSGRVLVLTVEGFRVPEGALSHEGGLSSYSPVNSPRCGNPPATSSLAPRTPPAGTSRAPGQPLAGPAV